MPRHEVDSVDHIRPHASALTVEHTHTEQAHLLCNTESSTADDSGYVRTMPVAVDATILTVNRVEDRRCTSAKLPVRGEYAGIDDVGVHALTIVVIRIEVVKRQIALIDAVESPRSVGLRVEIGTPVGRHANRIRVWRPNRDGAILLNECDLRVLAHRCR